jgi:dolichyldiphosphatase
VFSIIYDSRNIRYRFHLGYHSPSQVLWGVAIGVLFSITFYLVVELIPVRNPRSLLGQLRTKILSNPVSEWFRLRDGWLVWDDCGKEMEWQEWRKQLEKKKQ